MFYQLFYNYVSNGHSRKAAAVKEKPQPAPVFDGDVEPLQEYACDACEQAPLSNQSLVDINQLKEGAADAGLDSDEAPDANTPSISQRIKSGVLMRGMPVNARALLEDAKREEAGQRKRDRIPFIHPVVIELAADGRRIAGLTRDISALGIGLVHGTELEPQMVQVEARSSDDQLFHLKVELLWCVSCGAGWYFSGGLFR